MFLYSIGKPLVRFLLGLGGMRIIGSENIPKDRNVMVIANHTSFGDVPVIAMPFKQQLRFIAKEGFAANGFTRRLFSSLGATFLNSADSDLAAMRRVMSLIKQGESICIFPEGKRNFDQQLGEFKPGAAYIAYRTGISILPVGLLNTGDFWRFWKRNIIINIGKPIELDKSEKMTQEYLDKYNELFHSEVGALVEKNKRIIASEGKRMRAVPKKYK